MTRSISRERFLTYAGLVSIILLGAFLRLRGFGDASLWLDEGIVIKWASDPLSELPASLRSDAHPPLLHVLIHFLLYMGDSEWFLRFPSVLTGVMTISTLYVLGNQIFGRAVGLGGALLLAVSPFHIHFSQEIRPYGLLMLLSLLSVYTLWRALAKNQTRWWLLFSGVTALNLYTHYFAFLPVGGSFLFAVLVLGYDWIQHRNQSSLRKGLHLAWCFLIITLAYLPWLLMMKGRFLPVVAITAAPPEASRVGTDISFIGQLVQDFGGGIQMPASLMAQAFTLGLAVLVLRSNREALALVMCWVVPTLFTLTLWGPRQISARYPRLSSYLQPMYVMIAAVGVEGLASGIGDLSKLKSPRTLYVGISLLGVLGLSAVSVAAIGRYEKWNRADWKGAAAYVEKVASRGDIIVVDGLTYRAWAESSRPHLMISWYLRQNETELQIWKEIDVAAGIQSLADQERQVHAILFVSDLESWQADPKDQVFMVQFKEVLVLSLKEPQVLAVDNAVEMLEAMTRVLIPREAKFDLHVALAELYNVTGSPEKAKWHVAQASAKIPASFDPERWPEGYRLLELYRNRAPMNGTIEPSGGSVRAGQGTYFTTTWSDLDSWADLKSCVFAVGSTPGMADKALLYYDVPEGKLYIRSDDGSRWMGGFEPGSSNILENSQCKVYCADTRVSPSGDTMEVLWAMEFKPTFVGTQGMYLQCSDSEGAQTVYDKKGVWTIR